MSKQFNLLICLLILVNILGCGTFSRGPRIENVEMSLLDIQQAVIAALPKGRREVSRNRREFKSNYFLLTRSRGFIEAENHSKRFFAHIYILGDRRPYDIKVVVWEQQKVLPSGSNQPVYRSVRTDQRIAKRVLGLVKLELSKRTEDRNIIDDFRVF